MLLTHTATLFTPDTWFDINLPVMPSQYAQSFLAAGDSWFSLAAMPSYSLLFGLRFDRATMLMNCASPGATLHNMVDWRRRPLFASLLGPHADFRWHAILISSGGNDLINALDHLLLPFPASGLEAPEQVGELIDPVNFAKFDRYLRQNFAELIALRDAPGSPNREVPVFVHTYDYAMPRQAPAGFFGVPAFGPWLCTAMEKKGIPRAWWFAVSRHLQDRNAQILLSLDLPRLQVIDTRGMLTPAAADTSGADGDWSNEIHPSRQGYDKLAQRWSEALAALG